MSGRYIRLQPGRYTLAVSAGQGPAGIHRGNGGEVILIGVDGGRADFEVEEDEQAYYWWRGPGQRSGVRLLGLTRRDSSAGETVTDPESESVSWPTGTTG